MKTEEEVTAQEIDLFDKIGKRGKRLDAQTKLRLRMLVASMGYVERLRVQGKEPGFALVEQELSEALAEAGA